MHLVRSKNHLSRDLATKLSPTFVFWNKGPPPPQAGSRCTLSIGSFISLIADMQLMEEKSLSNKPDSACGWVLGARRARCPQAPRAPCSAVLLWQKSLGGTVRQRSCPCQGEPSPLSLPTSAIAQLLAVQLCGFLRDAVAGGIASDAPRPTKTHSKLHKNSRKCLFLECCGCTALYLQNLKYKILC